jgi:Arc/MetJ-type ribon-helix-helix transcriptional regulator
MTTTITLTPKQETELAALVAAGDFDSIEEAARAAIDETLFAAEVDGDDLSWVKPHLQEAMQQMKRGEGVPLAEHEREVSEFVASLTMRA